MCVGSVGTVVHDPPCRAQRLRLQGLKIEGLADDDFHINGGYGTKPQKKNTIERKEKSRDAARERRAKESDYFQELEQLVPVINPVPSISTATNVDKTSLIRLALAYLKTRSFIQNSLPLSPVKEEEIVEDIDVQSCLGGFSLILSDLGDVIYISNNVHKHIGLTMTELTGNTLSDFVHPCDHRQLEKLTPNMEAKSEDQWKEVFVRMKCTVTERGRIVNLKQASYKSVKITGRAHVMPVQVNGGGLQGTIFMGVVSLIGQDTGLPQQLGVFSTKHSQDMKFTEIDSWLCFVAGYKSQHLMGQSFFDLVHCGDIEKVQRSFKNLREQGQCETPSYRFLVFGGGWVWIKTAATLTAARRSSNKGQTVNCQHYQITEVEEKDKILALIQMEGGVKIGGKQRRPVRAISLEKDFKPSTCQDFGLDILSCEPLKLMEDIFGECSSKATTSLPRSVIIEHRQAEKNNKTPSSTLTSCPTSVIVNQRDTEGPKAVTESLFQINQPNQLNVTPKAVTAELFAPQKAVTAELFAPSKAVTAELFAPSKAVTAELFVPSKAVTAELFSTKGTPTSDNKLTSTGPRAVTSEIFGKKTLKTKESMDLPEKDDLKEENDIFASLLEFDNMEELERLAPYIGNDSMIPLTSLNLSDVEDTSDFEFPVLQKEDNKEEHLSKGFNNYDEPNSFEDKGMKQEILMNPNIDLMWGEPNSSSPPQNVHHQEFYNLNRRGPTYQGSQYVVKEPLFYPWLDLSIDGGGMGQLSRGDKIGPDKTNSTFKSIHDLTPFEPPKQVYRGRELKIQDLIVCSVSEMGKC